MEALRKNVRLTKALIVLFVAQLFVPLAAAASRPDNGLRGIIICTASGLKQITPNGDRIPVSSNTSSNQNQTSCFVCMTGGCFGSLDSPSVNNGYSLQRSAVQLVFLPDSQISLSSSSDAHFNVRAPPSV